MKSKEELADLCVQAYKLETTQEIKKLLATNKVFVDLQENVGHGELGDSNGYDAPPELIQVSSKFPGTITLIWL